MHISVIHLKYKGIQQFKEWELFFFPLPVGDIVSGKFPVKKTRYFQVRKIKWGSNLVTELTNNIIS